MASMSKRVNLKRDAICSWQYIWAAVFKFETVHKLNIYKNIKITAVNCDWPWLSQPLTLLLYTRVYVYVPIQNPEICCDHNVRYAHSFKTEKKNVFTVLSFLQITDLETKVDALKTPKPS